MLFFDTKGPENLERDLVDQKTVIDQPRTHICFWTCL